jgi:hypothetical protein
MLFVAKSRPDSARAEPRDAKARLILIVYYFAEGLVEYYSVV